MQWINFILNLFLFVRRKNCWLRNRNMVTLGLLRTVVRPIPMWNASLTVGVNWVRSHVESNLMTLAHYKSNSSCNNSLRDPLVTFCKAIFPFLSNLPTYLVTFKITHPSSRSTPFTWTYLMYVLLFFISSRTYMQIHSSQIPALNYGFTLHTRFFQQKTYQWHSNLKQFKRPM